MEIRRGESLIIEVSLVVNTARIYYWKECKIGFVNWELPWPGEVEILPQQKHKQFLEVRNLSITGGGVKPRTVLPEGFMEVGPQSVETEVTMGSFR